MAGSLRDQLLKAGAASKKQAHKASQAKRQQTKAAKRGDHSAAAEKAELKQKIAADAEAKAKRDKELNLKREAEKREREQLHAIAQIIKTNTQKADGDELYNLTLDGKIQRVYVSGSQRQQLTDGKLAVVLHRDSLRLLPVPVARKLAEKIPDQIFIADTATSDAAEDDPYAGYEVPDDLMW